MLVFVLNQAQKANTGKIQTPVYENVREFGLKRLSFKPFSLSVTILQHAYKITKKNLL